jgi:nucleotide-binding universal stress UspA family protein
LKHKRYHHIVCATRGGDESQRTEEQATQVARESGAALTFLYVVNPELPEAYTAKFCLKLVNKELADIGRAVLEVAQRRAAAQGVMANTVLRQGLVHEEIAAYMDENPAVDLLVLGRLNEALRKRLIPLLQRLQSQGRGVLIVEPGNQPKQPRSEAKS